MNNRLTPSDNQWIDRNKPITFAFEGQTYQGYQGDVLTSALWANGVRMMGRSFKYHRPRGIYSLANHDISCMVTDGKRTNMRGDVLPITQGLDVRAVNTVGGLQRDKMKITERLSAFMPVGFYYKAFHTPRWAFPIHENMMRKAAGLGKVSPENKPPLSPKDYAFCDVLVVGGGPAGLAAAISAAKCELDVLLVDEQPQLGGSFTWQWGASSQAQQTLQEMIEQVQSLKNITVRCNTTAGGWYGDHWVALFDAKHMTKLRAKATVFATGAIEQPAVFQNNDLPGVMLGSAAQRLMFRYGVKPFERAVVLAANGHGYQVALDLHHAGVQVAAVVDLRSQGEQSALGKQVSELGIVVHKGYAIYEAQPTANKTSIRAVMLCKFNSQGGSVPSANPIKIDCDGVAVSVGWTPAGHLLYQAGIRFAYDAQVEQLVPRSNSRLCGKTPHCGSGSAFQADDRPDACPTKKSFTAEPNSVFACGMVNGVFDLADQMADGARAGLAAAAQLDAFSGSVPEAIKHHGPAPSHPYPIISHPGKKNFVEFDEDLHLIDFVNAHQEGYDNIELMKRYTTVGMGPSQGKLANMNAVRILAKLNKQSIDQTGTTTARPFYHPVPIGHLAGKRFHPMRHTALHSWHVANHAKMMHAGSWYRPEYYQRGSLSRADCIFQEASHVRSDVGLVDVSTLGKLEIAGPDAAIFLERMYTGKFAKLQVGRYRYGAACDETGVLIEDGVIARLGENRFYVTATSSGAAAFYREMQRWAMIWKLDVILINNTGGLAAMNITGPKSREVLSRLTDVDLSGEAFKYLGVKQGNVAGVRAILMRVGFVGELGYEIHVPASFGRHVWTALIQAGQDAGIRPFGVEAQRLLRLEKGHIIISQDTDALTHPQEVGLGWAMGKNKPFYVGQRSIKILQDQEQTRRLVGLVFKDAPGDQLPDECHLMIDDGQMVGRLTSIAKRSTLGHPIALGFVRPDLATPGTDVSIRIDGGQMVHAKVVAIPFYDPENARQN